MPYRGKSIGKADPAAIISGRKYIKFYIRLTVMTKILYSRKILLVEDDLVLSNTLRNYLTSKNYFVAQAYCLERAFDIIKESTFDLVIVDRQLGESDGLELVSHINHTFPETMIFILTQRSHLLDRIMGLSLGADEYLAKPFSLKEFALRLQSLLSKKKQLVPVITFGDFSLYYRIGVLQTPQGKLRLSYTETQLLRLLLQNRNSILSREKIVQTLWPGTEDQPTSSTIDVYIRRLRMSLGNFGKYIQTSRGYGYYLAEPQNLKQTSVNGAYTQQGQSNRFFDVELAG
ncbi:MAG: response regulator transcription factor [Patescibacteria group bacterium]